MTHSGRPSRGIVILALASGMLAVVGCHDRSDPPRLTTTPTLTGAAHPASAPEAVEAPDNAPLFPNWPTPAGVLIVSGEQIGYLEPCGCTAGQRGGLARRLDLIQRLRKQGWPLALIDLGSLANDPNTMGGPEESRIRFSVALKALELMRYDAVALSASDLKLGVGEVLIRVLNHPGDKLKVVAANVTPDPGLDLGKRLVPAVRTEAGPVKIGITAIVGQESFDKLNDPEKAALLTFRDPDEALNDVLPDLERDTHMQVLMVQGAPETARKLAQAHPGFEIVVATSEFTDPPQDAEMLNDGKTQLIAVGRKGQYVGVVGLYQDPAQKFRYQRVELGLRFNGKTEAMRKLVDEDFQAELKQAGVLENYPRHAFVSGDTPADATFVGAETCKQCHPKTYDHWAGTAHAHAFESLSADPKRNRTFDAHCVSCHTVGFEYTGGFVTAATTPQFKGVQCENCHGPASLHVTEPTHDFYRAALRRSAADEDKNQRCVKCHSEDDSPHFEFATYWPKVAHPNLDNMDDARVRRGIKLPASR